MRNYWFVSEFYWPNENSTGHIITRIVDTFTIKNKANVITVGHINSEERNQNIHTIRIKENVFLDKNKIFQRLIKLINLSIRIAVLIIQNIRQKDVVITVTNPAFILVFLAFVKLLKKNKLIIIVHDLFPENLLIAKIIKKKNILYKIAMKIFNFAYNKGDQLIVCGRDMQETLIKKVKDKNKVIYIPNFGDTDILFPIEKKKNTIIKNLQIENKLVILFAGNIGRLQNIDYLINTAEILKEDDSIVFLFIGNGVFEDIIKDYSKRNANFIYIGNMDRNESSIFLNAGDIGIATLVPNIMGVGVPSKTYSYMATGKPIIAVMDNDAEIAMMVQEEGIGWVVDPNNPKQLAILLKQLKNDTMQIKIKGEISYKLSKTKYSIENITTQYVKAINNI